MASANSAITRSTLITTHLFPSSGGLDSLAFQAVVFMGETVAGLVKSLSHSLDAEAEYHGDVRLTEVFPNRQSEDLLGTWLSAFTPPFIT